MVITHGLFMCFFKKERRLDEQLARCIDECKEFQMFYISFFLLENKKSENYILIHETF